MNPIDPASQETLHVILSAASFILGGLIGSFLNVCVHRMPLGLSVVKPRSRCPRCENPLAWYDNVPVMSWLILGAKCRNCKEPISWQYPLVEAITAVLFYFVFMEFGMSIATPVYMLLAASLVLVTFIDLTDWTIPNEITYPGMPLGVLIAFIAMAFPESGLLVDSPLSAIIGLALGYGILKGLSIFSLLVFKKHGMGGGDVKLLGMLGAFFGPAGVLLIIVVSSLVGSIIGGGLILANRGKETDFGGKNIGHYIPFGPYIVLGAFVHLFAGARIIEMYLNYIGVNADFMPF